MTRRFSVNGQTFEVLEQRPGFYIARVGSYSHSFHSVTGAHKDVLLTFLNEAGQDKVIDVITANWPEDMIEELV